MTAITYVVGIMHEVLEEKKEMNSIIDFKICQSLEMRDSKDKKGEKGRLGGSEG